MIEKLDFKFTQEDFMRRIIDRLGMKAAELNKEATKSKGGKPAIIEALLKGRSLPGRRGNNGSK